MRRLVVAGLAVCVGLVLAGCGDDSDSGGTESDRADQTPSSTALAIASDDAWCAGWQELVQAQALWVAAPTPESSTALLAVVDSLQALGVPKSLDPSGYTELTAVLDDVRASIDPSFTPSVAPSEPADVGDGHDHSDEGRADADHEEAPFGTWLADYCAA
jgi:hypothetical protein